MDNKRIGNFIRELREKEGLSQGALAKKVFVASSVVSRWESGVAGVSASNLVLLSEIFHVSLDELVAGHRFDGESKEEKEEVLIGVLNSHQEKSRYIKRLLHFIIVLLIIFLGYFFYNFYNSVKVYTIHMDTDKYNINYGMLTKTRDRIYFHLDIDPDVNKDDIENISIYYNLGNERKDIIKSNILYSFNFIDYYGYEEYISFNEFDKVIDNMYFEITYTDNSVEKYKLNFERNYANIDFFLRKNRRISKGINEEYNESVTSDADIKMEKARSILSDNNGIMNVKYEDVNYDVFLNDYGIKLYFFDDNVENSYIYSNQNYITFEYQRKINNDWEHVYSMNITKNECAKGDCVDFINHYSDFSGVLDLIVDDTL